MIENSSYNNILIFKCIFYLYMNKYICFESIKIKCAIFLQEGFPFDSHEHFPLPFSITLHYPSWDCILLCDCRMIQLTPGFLWSWGNTD